MGRISTGRYHLPVICDQCGSDEIFAIYDSERAVIKCETCNARLFAYYKDKVRRKQGHIPAQVEDEFFTKKIERELLSEAGDAAAAIYIFLRRYHDAHGFPPTQREIQAALGFGSRNTVRICLDRLSEVGLIEREEGVSRGIRLIHAA